MIYTVQANITLAMTLSYAIDSRSALLFFFQYVFVTETVAGPKQKTVHEELAQYMKAALRPNQADQLIVSKFLKHIWFFFEILVKSMAQYLLSTDRIKVHVISLVFLSVINLYTVSPKTSKFYFFE